MSDKGENDITFAVAAAHPFNFETVPGYDSANAYFTGKEGWVSEGKACWGSRDKMARIQPDGIGFNFEVWRVDGVPLMLYCQILRDGDAAFAGQAKDAGL